MNDEKNIRKIRQANEALIDLKNKINGKMVLPADYFLYSLKYDAIFTLKNIYLLKVTEDEFSSIYYYLLRRLLEIKAILELHNKNKFNELNYKLFKTQASKKFGKNELLKYSKEMHIPFNTVENRFANYSPIYLFSLVEDYDSFSKVVDEVLNEEDRKIYDFYGILIHDSIDNANLKTKNSMFLMNYNEKLIKFFEKYLKEYKRLGKFDYINKEETIKSYFIDIVEEDRSRRIQFARMCPLLVVISDYIARISNIFLTCSHKEDKSFLYSSLKCIYEQLSTYRKAIELEDDTYFDEHFRSYLKALSNFLNKKLSEIDNKVELDYKEINDEINKLSLRFNVSKTDLLIKVNNNPLNVLYLKNVNYTKAVNSLFQLDETNSLSLIKSYTNIVKDGHTPLFSAFINEKDVDKELKEAVNFIFKFYEFVINHYLNKERFVKSMEKGELGNDIASFKVDLYQNLKKIEELKNLILNNLDN